MLAGVGACQGTSSAPHTAAAVTLQPPSSSAGASQHAAVEDVSAGVARQMFELNVLGPLALTRAALPFLLSRRRCRIVVVSSMAAVVPAPGVLPRPPHALCRAFAACSALDWCSQPFLPPGAPNIWPGSQHSLWHMLLGAGQAVYSATKLALHGYFQTLQSELNDRQDRVSPRLLFAGP